MLNDYSNNVVAPLNGETNGLRNPKAMAPKRLRASIAIFESNVSSTKSGSVGLKQSSSSPTRKAPSPLRFPRAFDLSQPESKDPVEICERTGASVPTDITPELPGPKRQDEQKQSDDKPNKTRRRGLFGRKQTPQPQQNPSQGGEPEHLSIWEKIRKKKERDQQERLRKAATSIQTVVRGFIERRNFLYALQAVLQHRQAIKIQARARCFIAMRQYHRCRQQTSACIKIQSLLRALIPRLQYRLHRMEAKLQAIEERKSNDLRAVEDRFQASVEKMRHDEEKKAKKKAQLRSDNDALIIKECNKVASFFRKENKKLRKKRKKLKLKIAEMMASIQSQTKLKETTEESYTVLTKRAKEVEAVNESLKSAESQLAAAVANHEEAVEGRRRHCELENTLKERYASQVDKMIQEVTSRCSETWLVSDLENIRFEGIGEILVGK